MAKFFLGVGAALVIVAIAAGVFVLGRNQNNKNVNAQPSPGISSTAPTTSSTAPVGKSVTKADVVEAIKAAVMQKKYADLSSHMEAEVNVLLYATECCGLISKDEAIGQLAYLNSATQPWEFDQSNSVIVQLGAKHQDFKDATVGISQNRYAFAFHLNNQNKIDKIAMVADYELITN